VAADAQIGGAKRAIEQGAVVRRGAAGIRLRLEVLAAQAEARVRHHAPPLQTIDQLRWSRAAPESRYGCRQSPFCDRAALKFRRSRFENQPGSGERAAGEVKMINPVGALASVGIAASGSVQQQFQVAALKSQQELLAEQVQTLLRGIDPNKGTLVDRAA
jgi:hypothetical protein